MLFTAGFAVAAGFGTSPEIDVESVVLGGLASLSVRCELRGASVWVDNQLRGPVPIDVVGLQPGSHLVVIGASGYYDTILRLTLAADTKTTVTATLERRTGFLDVRSNPPDATVIVDGEEYSTGTIEVPAGMQTVVVRAFGYRERYFSIRVPERLVVTLDATLEPAPFEAEGFSVSTQRFNPLNSGLKGSARVSFSVSAPGRASFTVNATDGSIVAGTELEPFDDWEQVAVWDGRDADGAPVPDGTYSLRLEARAESGIESVKAEYVFEADVEVDSSLVVVPTGSFGALPGSVHSPEALSPAANGFRFDASVVATGAFDSSAVGVEAAMGASLSLESLMELGLGVEFGSDDTSAVLAGLRISAPVDIAHLGLAAVVDGRASAATAGDPAYARLGAAVGFGSRFANITVHPRIAAHFEDGFSARAGAGAAVSLGGYSWSASISAEASTVSLADGFAVAWPLGSALEFRFAPNGLPLAFRILGGVDWSPEPSAWFAGLGLSAEF
jgi:hypothetical protein